MGSEYYRTRRERQAKSGRHLPVCLGPTEGCARIRSSRHLHPDSVAYPMNKQEILDTLCQHADELRKQYGVAHIGIFGSAARGELRPDSDIDVLVEFAPAAHIGLFGFVRLQHRLEQLLSRKVDLATPSALKKQIKAGILKDLVHAA